MSKPNYTRNNNKKAGYRKGNSGQSRKPRSSGKDCDSAKRNDDAPGNINDASYYYGDATVLDQVMNFSFNEFGGVPIDMRINNSGTLRTGLNSMIATYWLNPSVPQSANSANPFQMEGTTTAALRNFLLLSGSNAKTTTYAPQDVIILTLAVAELIKTATFIARAFGIAYLFNYRNRTYPETLLRAMGIDAADMNSNLADYRVRFNKLLAIASKIPFPAEIPLFKKAAELYASIYLDDPSSALAQTYMFCPYSVWLFDENYDTNGAGLKTTTLVTPSTTTTLGAILTTFETMISSLVNSTSLNAIYSDIIRLVQNNKVSSLITFSSIPEDFVVMPVFNEEIKIWIHNAIVLGAPLATSAQYNPGTLTLTPDNDVSCDASNNKILYHPQFKFSVDCGYEALIDFDHDNVTVDDKVKATRLSHRWTTVKNSSTYYTADVAMNDEYLVEISYFTGTTSGVDGSFNTSFEVPATIARVQGIADILTKFDWAPLDYLYISTGSLSIVGDLDYYTLLDYPTVKKIYDYEIIHLLQIG